MSRPVRRLGLESPREVKATPPVTPIDVPFMPAQWRENAAEEWAKFAADPDGYRKRLRDERIAAAREARRWLVRLPRWVAKQGRRLQSLPKRFRMAWWAFQNPENTRIDDYGTDE